MSASGLIRGGAPMGCRPWERFQLSVEAWHAMARELVAKPGLAFVALWADAGHVHALFQGDAPVIASVAVEAGLYAALSPARPGAALFERAVADLWGHLAADAVDVRPWLDHGTWPTLRPLSDRPVPNRGATAGDASDWATPELPEMLEAAGQAVSFGPLPPGMAGPGMAGPGYWRMTLEGMAVRRLEARMGYAHRGVLGLMRGKSAAGAARVVARIDGAATVAHSTAFARAVEAAVGAEVPARGVALREVALAVERVAVRLHGLHAVVEAAGGTWPAVQVAREGLLAACGAAFGHRLMMEVVRPGGVGEVSAEGLAGLDAALAAVPGLRRRWGRGGALPIGEALRLGVGGVVGRASGRGDPMVDAPLLAAGDVAARMQLTAQAIRDDGAAARAGLAALPADPAAITLAHVDMEGLGVAEGPQGPVWHWVRLADGVVAASFAAAPGWLHVPAAERAAVGADVAAVPAIVASFGLGVAGMDL